MVVDLQGGLRAALAGGETSIERRPPMQEERTADSLKAILRFPFQGPEWQNRLLIGVALNLASFVIPILPSFFVNGYLLRVMRVAIEGDEPGLPAWEDWGGLFRDGLRATLVGIAYLLPATVVMFGGMLIYILMPLGLIGGSGPVTDGDTIDLLFPLGFFLSMGSMFIAMAVGMLLYTAGIIPLPTALAHFAAEDDISAAFRVRSWWPILTADKLGYFVDWVVVAGLAAIGYMASMAIYSTGILCWATPFLMVPLMLYAMLIAAVLFGQRYSSSKAAVAGG
jgi:hypothetical protein